MTINRTKTIILTALLALTGVSQAAKYNEPANPPQAIDPSAIDALKKMGAFLRTQQTFTIRTTTDHDYVLDTGQKVRETSHGRLRVQRPDRLRADVVSDRKERQFFYDGKTFTIYAPRVGYYATVKAPATLNQLADLLKDRYALELPLVDLFRWGTDQADLNQIRRAVYVGSAKIDGVDTDHYAFRQPGLDWQIWIEHGAYPLPRKLVLTTTDDPARPEHSVALKWDFGAEEDSQFTFIPPKDSHQIAMADLFNQRAAQGHSARRGAPRAR
jgi:hypothetical protein